MKVIGTVACVLLLFVGIVSVALALTTHLTIEHVAPNVWIIDAGGLNDDEDADRALDDTCSTTEQRIERVDDLEGDGERLRVICGP